MSTETKRPPRSPQTEPKQDRPKQDRSKADKPEAAAPLSEFRAHNGVRALFVQGRAVPCLFFDVEPNTTSAHIRAAVEAGARLLRVRSVGLGWTGPAQYNYRALEARVRPLLDASPDVMLMLEADVNAPEWWRRAHIVECATFCLSTAQAGETASNSLAAPADKPEGMDKATDGAAGAKAKTASAESLSPCASWASRLWLSEAGDALARLARHVSQSDWANRCIGWQVAGGEAGTWRHIDWQRFPDSGPRMAERFRAFCVDKYRRNTGLLKKGWDDPRADFDRITCPSAYERRYADLGMLRDPLRSRRMLDYYECFYNAQNDAALHFCGLLKRVTQGRAIVGLAYASPFGQASNAEGAHGLPEALFDSPDVDFIVDAPSAPDALYSTTFAGSLALRDKFLFHAAHPSRSPLLEAGLAQTYGAGLFASAAASPADIASTVRFGAQSTLPALSGNKRAAQIAVIADALGPTYLAGKDDVRAMFSQSLFAEQMAELARTGAAFDVYLLSDLFHPRFQDHKVTLFLNTFYLSEAERRRIDARVKRSEQVGVWMWGAGLLTEAGPDEASAQKLLGLKLRLEKKETSLRVRVVEDKDALTWGFHVGSHFGPERAVLPTLTIADKAATRLGANTDNKTTFSVKRSDVWTSVYAGTLPLSANVLRNIFRMASVHLYADTAGKEDRIAASTRLVAVSSQRGGTLKVNLTAPHDITDAMTRQRLESGSDTSLKLAPGETRLLDIKPLPKRKDAPTGRAENDAAEPVRPS